MKSPLTFAMQGLALRHLPELASELGGQSHAGLLSHLKPLLFAAVRNAARAEQEFPSGSAPVRMSHRSAGAQR